MRIVCILLFSIMTKACIQYSGVSGTDFPDFRNQVSLTSGSGSLDCGQVESNGSQLEVNSCVAESFVNKISFFAIYKEQGVDSFIATGIAYVSNSNTLYFMIFDSDPSGGGRSDNGRIDQTECKGAVFQGSVDVNYFEMFSCQQG